MKSAMRNSHNQRPSDISKHIHRVMADDRHLKGMRGAWKSVETWETVVRVDFDPMNETAEKSNIGICL